MNATAWTSRAAAGLVAGVAGYASFNHIVSVARDAGEHITVAAVLPLSIDGLIVVGTMAMLDDKRSGRRPRLSGRVALAFGVIATLAANIASAAPSMTARLVAAVPAIAFLIAVEVLARRGTPIATDDVTHTITDDVTEPPAEPPARDPWDYATPIGPKPPPAVKPQSAGRKPAKKTVPKSLTSADKVARAAQRKPDATSAEIAVKAGVSEATARRHLQALARAAQVSSMTSPNGPLPAETRPDSINGHNVLEGVNQ
jgi:hypothetical protein